MIYLDNAATTFPLPKCVCDEMDRINNNLSVNAGRGSYKSALKASEIIEQVRDRIRVLFGAEENKVFFAPSATIALNQVFGGRKWRRGDVVYVSPYEHNSVLRPLYRAVREYGAEISELPLNDGMEIDLDLIKDMFILNRPSLVCLTYVSNVTGYVLPVKEICKLAKAFDAEVLVDASQSAGLLDTNMNDIDYLVFAGHKTLYGPFGAAGMVLGRDTKLEAFLCGGTGSDSLRLDMPSALPDMYEPGSMNISAIGGLGAALDFIKGYGARNIYKHERKLTQRLIKGLSEIDGVLMYLPDDLNSHIGIVSFNIKNYTAEECGQILDMDFDIAVRTGYHCAALIHNHLRDREYLGTVRASTGLFTREEDIDALISSVKSIAEE